MAGNFTPTPRVKNALDNRKLSLSVRCPGTKEADRAFSALQWGLFSNNPRITVYTNDPQDTGESKEFGKISANLDGPIFFAFLAMLQQMIDIPLSAPPEQRKVKIENKNWIWPGGKRSDKPVVKSELHCGKDDDGTIWISVTSFDKTRPRIKFPFVPSDLYHRFLNGDGTPVTNEQLSKVFAQGYVNMLTSMMANMMTDNFVEPEKKENNNRGGGNRGGGGGGYNNGRSGGGGGDEGGS